MKLVVEQGGGRMLFSWSGSAVCRSGACADAEHPVPVPVQPGRSGPVRPPRRISTYVATSLSRVSVCLFHYVFDAKPPSLDEVRGSELRLPHVRSAYGVWRRMVGEPYTSDEAGRKDESRRACIKVSNSRRCPDATSRSGCAQTAEEITLSPLFFQAGTSTALASI